MNSNCSHCLSVTSKPTFGQLGLRSTYIPQEGRAVPPAEDLNQWVLHSQQRYWCGRPDPKTMSGIEVGREVEVLKCCPDLLDEPGLRHRFSLMVQEEVASIVPPRPQTRWLPPLGRCLSRSFPRSRTCWTASGPRRCFPPHCTACRSRVRSQSRH